MSDTTDDLWFLTEGESEQVSVEMKEAALEEGSGGEGETAPEEDDGGGKEEKADKEVGLCSWGLLFHWLGPDNEDALTFTHILFCFSAMSFILIIEIFCKGSNALHHKE